MKIDETICDLIQFASDKGYPVHVNTNDIVIDAFGDGTFHIFWSDLFRKVLISRRLEYKNQPIKDIDEFKSLLYRRLHGSDESEEEDLPPDFKVIGSGDIDDSHADYYRYL
ncbi:TPA: hypothetical protein ACTADN_001896 [Salmonella enterica subsp. enterica serovar Birkenhead]